LSAKDLNGISLPIPPLEEQKRIVAKIDAAFEKIDKLKANAEKNLVNAKELFQSALDEAMRPKKGWEEKRLGEVYRFIDYRGKTPNKISSGVPLVTAKNIRMGYVDYTQRDYISEEEFATRQTRGIAHKGDILFTTEAPMGFVAIADLDVFSTGQRVITFQQFENSKLNLLNRYYFYHFQASGFQGEIKKRATGATAQGIKASRLREIQVPILPIAEQREIVKRLDVLSGKSKLLEQNYTRQIADCAEMRQAVLREAFEGRL
jgi:type I restriction enzyme S subunit